jgi:hypothetical protein
VFFCSPEPCVTGGGAVSVSGKLHVLTEVAFPADPHLHATIRVMTNLADVNGADTSGVAHAASGRNREMWRWLVIIERDRPELWLTWTCLYGGAERIAILVDRRQGQPGTTTGDRPDRRARSAHESDLQKRGFLVISQPVSAGASS